MNFWSRQIIPLHILSSEDYFLIKEVNNSKFNRRFNAIGALVLVILIGSFISAFLLTKNIFNSGNWLFNIFLSFFIAYVITMIYVFLLYTITPPLLVDKKMLKVNRRNRLKKKQKLSYHFEEDTKKFFKWFFSLTVLVRFIFIIIFSLTLSQPIIVSLLEKTIENDISNEKIKYKAESFFLRDIQSIHKELDLLNDFVFTNSLVVNQDMSSEEMGLFETLQEKVLFDTIYSNRLELILNLENKSNADYAELNRLLAAEVESDSLFLSSLGDVNGNISPDLHAFISNIQNEISNKIDSHHLISNLLDQNTFYLKKINILSSNPLSLLISLICLIVFISPIFLKFRLRRIVNEKNQSFYSQKKIIEEKLVVKEYQNFLKDFIKILQENNLNNCKKTLINLNPHLEKLKKHDLEKANKIQEEIKNYYSLKEFEFYNKFIDPPFNLKPIEKNRKFINYIDAVDFIHSEADSNG